MDSPSIGPTNTPVSYRALVHPEEEGGYWAEIPDLPGCFTQGDTLDEIYHNLAEAIACHLDLDPEAVRVGVLEIASSAPLPLIRDPVPVEGINLDDTSHLWELN